MSTTNGGPVEATASNSAPQLMVLAQYTKDLSFENPNAPGSLQQTTQPQISISVNVVTRPLSDTDIEVTLRLEGKAETAGSVMFNIELQFAGVFRSKRAAGAGSTAGADRMPAAVVFRSPARSSRHRCAMAASAADARSDRFRRSISSA